MPWGTPAAHSTRPSALAQPQIQPCFSASSPLMLPSMTIHLLADFMQLQSSLFKFILLSHHLANSCSHIRVR